MSKKKNGVKCVFKKDDFNSADGMLTYVWGPSLWHFLHTMSFNYPIKPTNLDKKNYFNYIKSLEHILPCRYCRENFKKNMKKTNFSMKKMKDRTTFSKYIFDLHNHINNMLHKKSSISYEQVRNRYENFRSRCSTNDKSNNKSNNKGNIKFSCKKTKKCMKMCKCINKNKKEKGCTTPLNGVKSKCLIRIVPLHSKKKTFNMDPKCMTTVNNNKN
jgi:hypothetical protein